MVKIPTILVEDSPIGMQVLQTKLLKYCGEDIDIIATCESYEAALEKIPALKPQLVFLDIELGNRSGFELMDNLPYLDFQVVITTEHKDYATQSYQVQALHYILKPYEPALLKDAVDRAKRQIEAAVPKAPETRVRLNSTKGFTFTDIGDIIYCEADSNYCEVHMVGRTHLISKPLKHVEEKILLNNTLFTRVSAKHLINLDHLQEYERGSHVVMSNGKELFVTRTYKKSFEDRLNL